MFVLAVLYVANQVTPWDHRCAQGDVVALMGGDKAPCSAELLRIEEEHAAREATGNKRNNRVLFLSHQDMIIARSKRLNKSIVV